MHLSPAQCLVAGRTEVGIECIALNENLVGIEYFHGL